MYDMLTSQLGGVVDMHLTSSQEPLFAEIQSHRCCRLCQCSAMSQVLSAAVRCDCNRAQMCVAGDDSKTIAVGQRQCGDAVIVVKGLFVLQ